MNSERKNATSPTIGTGRGTIRKITFEIIIKEMVHGFLKQMILIFNTL